MPSENNNTGNSNKSKNKSKSIWSLRNIPSISSLVFIIILGMGVFYFLYKKYYASTQVLPSDNIFEDFIRDRTGIKREDYTKIGKLFYKNTAIFAFLALVASIFYYIIMSIAPNMSLFLYLLAIVIPIILVFSGISLINDTSVSFTKNLQLFIGALLAFLSIGYIYEYGGRATTSLVGYITQIVIGLIVITGLAIFYYFFMDYLRRQTGTAGFLITLLFYIPCLYSDFIKYFKEQLKITPSIVSILFLLEIVLIAAYIYIPKIASLLLSRKTTLLLGQPVFLNTENIIAGSKTFLLNPTVPKSMIDNTTTYINSNYAISFWAFINPGSQSQSGYSNSKVQGNILSYAEGKPRIIYKNYDVDDKSDTKHRNKYIVYFSNNNPEDSKYELSLPIQKWNYFVFNYYDNKADLYVNGELQHTIAFDKNNTPLNGRDIDVIKVGEKEGLAGAICNVNYFKQPISQHQIVTEYNLYYKSTPPVPYS